MQEKQISEQDDYGAIFTGSCSSDPKRIEPRNSDGLRSCRECPRHLLAESNITVYQLLSEPQRVDLQNQLCSGGMGCDLDPSVNWWYNFR